MPAELPLTEYRITTEYIELNQLLKLCGLAGSGGEGGALVTQGNVKVDGVAESRKRCKIRPGQRVTLGDTHIQVLAADTAEIAEQAAHAAERARLRDLKKAMAKPFPGTKPKAVTAKPGGSRGAAKPSNGPSTKSAAKPKARKQRAS